MYKVYVTIFGEKELVSEKINYRVCAERFVQA